MADPTYAEFLKLVKPNMLGPDGRFLGPGAGVNYMLEGMTPQQAYASATQQRTFANDDVGHGPGGAREQLATMDRQGLNPNWRTGPNNGGGFIGGLGNFVQGAWDGFRTNPALMAAAGGAFASYAGVPGFGGEAAAAGPGSAGWGMDLGTDAVAGGVPGVGDAGWGLDLGTEAVTGGGTPALGAEGVIPGMDQTAAETARLGSMNSGTNGLAGISPGASLPTGSFTELAMKYGPQVAKMLLGAGAAKALSGDESGSGTGGTGSIDDIISHAFGNTQAMEHDYNTLFKPWAIDQVGQITARGNEGYDTLMGLSREPNKNLDSYQQYVDRLGTQGYRDQQRGQAMGEVQQQSDMGLDQARRAAVARGVDPGRFAMQQNANAMGVAAAKTKAAADAEGMAWDQWGKGAERASTMRQADGNYRAGLVTGANTLGQSGFNAGTKLATIDGAYRGGLTDNMSRLVGVQTGANQVANQQNQWQDQHSLKGLATSAIADWGGKWIKDNGSKVIDSAWDWATK